MTPAGNHGNVPRTRITALAAVFAAVSLAGSAAAAKAPALPPGWSHAEVNVVVKGTPHTLIYDRGKVQTFAASGVTLRERDGSVVTIPVAPNATVKINGRPALLADVRVGATVQTKRVDGGPAVLVQAVQTHAAFKAAAGDKARGKARGRSR